MDSLVSAHFWRPVVAWLILFAFLTLISSGCGPTPAVNASPKAALEPMGKGFDPQQVGAMQGFVQWSGPVPQPQDLVVHWPDFPTRRFPNPHAPLVEPTTQALAGAVVFLRGVDPQRSRPWPFPPARLEMRDQQFFLFQGAQPCRVAFVPQGDSLALHNLDASYHAVRARGAAFMTVPVHPDTKSQLVLHKPGHAELSSGCSFFWARGHVYVADHAYFTQTDDQGRFQFDQVPEGNYDVVCWLPNWEVARKEYHPELRIIHGITFAPPLESTFPVQVRRGQVAQVRLEMVGPGR